MFGLQLHWSTVPLSVPVMALALLAFLPFGLLFAALTVVVKQGSVGTSWVIALLSIVGGLYFPVSLLPHWVQTVGHAAAVHGRRRACCATCSSTAPSAKPPEGALVKLALFAAVLVPASILVLSRAIRLGQRRGTIIEY